MKKIIIITMLLISLATIAITQTKVLDKITLEKEAGYVTYIATAYSLKGKMASGARVFSGAIAADPKMLKIGTKVHIKGLGYYTVQDTGGSIKRNRIDIWMPDRAAAMRFGRRKVELKIL